MSVRTLRRCPHCKILTSNKSVICEECGGVGEISKWSNDRNETNNKDIKDGIDGYYCGSVRGRGRPKFGDSGLYRNIGEWPRIKGED